MVQEDGMLAPTSAGLAEAESTDLGFPRGARPWRDQDFPYVSGW